MAKKAGIKGWLLKRLPGHTGKRRLVYLFAVVCAIIVTLLIVSSLLVWMLERGRSDATSITSFWDGIWWALVTVATVGYGDRVPATPYGRLVGMVLIVVGFTLLSVFTGLVASLFVEDRMKGAKGLKQLRAREHVVICGWNNTAEFLLRALQERKWNDVELCLVMNQTAEFFESLESRYPNLQLLFVRGEITQEEVQKRASLHTASQVIVLADQNLERQSGDDRSIIIANAIRDVVSRDVITVQLHNTENKSHLTRIGISNVLIYDDLSGYILANAVSDPSSIVLINQLIKNGQKRISPESVPVEWIGKKYGDLCEYYLKERDQILLGLMTKEAELEIDAIFADDTSAIDQFIKSTLGKARGAQQEDKNSIRWKPDNNYVIQESDHAILLS